jgi:GNAT superfamily N-acetyltransferase
MEYRLRIAAAADADEMSELIAHSVRRLASGIYTQDQIERSIRTVFGVDYQLIADGTYFVAEAEGRIVGCGGWSKRRTLYGASGYDLSRDSELLNPAIDASKIRAFFIHPDAARKGIGRAILERCEAEAKDHGFTSAEMMATLPGVPLYEACGYHKHESVGVPVGDGVDIECIRMTKEFG